ncbi:hypothetical protein C0Q70_19087 [Pomacea canaliculata]|uniref:Uncharacterized protein n=1 Tax=Pomacea canaliculata TaxID=400727 RepID=A0A2T7NIC6_POMCA|nr:hypothetical protein C0Q70_19087 [Pomacea canaliculata]
MACRQTFHLLVSLSLLASTQALIGDGCIAIPSIVKNLHRSDSSTKLHTATCSPLGACSRRSPGDRRSRHGSRHMGESGFAILGTLQPSMRLRPVALKSEPHCCGIELQLHSGSVSEGMFAKTLNSAVLDLIQIPCGQSANSPCVRTLWYSCGDKAFGWSQAFELQKQDATVPASPGPQIAVVGDMGVPHGLSTIAAIAKRMTSTMP